MSNEPMPKADYILIDKKIKETYADIIKREKRVPKQEEVAKLCDITRETVNRHIQKIDLRDLVQPFKLFGNDILMGLLDEARKGNARAAKLFLALVFDWTDKQQGDVPIEQNVTIYTSNPSRKPPSTMKADPDEEEEELEEGEDD